jgi:peptidyl-prolyl cis-trans isomerase C
MEMKNSNTTPGTPESNLVLVEVNGQTLTANDLNDRVEARLSQQADALKPEQVAQAIGSLRAATLHDFITATLLEGEAAARDVVPPAGELEKAMADVAGRLPAGVNLKEALSMGGVSLDDFKERLNKELRVRAMVDQELVKAPPATEEEAATFYKEQQAALETPDMVTARHILVMSDEHDDEKTKAAQRAKIDGIRGQLVGGADFETLAKEHSECPSGKEGGSLGSFGRGQMVKPFEDAAFSQAVNEIGPVVETPFGYHLVQVTGKQGGTIRPYAECKQVILDHLNKINRHRVFMALIEALKAKAVIRLDPSVEAELAKA